MKRRHWAGITVLGLLAVSVGIAHNAAHRAALTRDAAACRRFLQAESELPSSRATAAIAKTATPNAQAALLAAWLKEQDSAAAARIHLVPAAARVTLSQVTLSRSASAWVLHARFMVTRHFKPRGESQVTGYASFWLTPGTHPRVEAQSLNTDPITASPAPDAFSLNLWNQVPAPALPHGQ